MPSTRKSVSHLEFEKKNRLRLVFEAISRCLAILMKRCCSCLIYHIFTEIQSKAELVSIQMPKSYCLAMLKERLNI